MEANENSVSTNKNLLGLMRGQIKLKGDNATSSGNATSSTNSTS